MNTEENLATPIFMNSETVLPVQDVVATVEYWQKTLGFPHKWTWGDPINHGGVSWQTVGVQFAVSTKWKEAPKGQYLWIRVTSLDTVYALHQKNKAEIVSPLEDRPWGMREYVIREINGHYVCFSEPIVGSMKSSATLPTSVKIHPRVPTPGEYRFLTNSVGWSATANDVFVNKILSAAVFGAVAEDTITKDIIGCALLLGDDASFYYVKDVMVRPDWQNKRVGTAIMRTLTQWLDANAPDNSYIGLFTGEGLTGFYRQFGFGPAYGMQRRIHKDEPEI